MKLGDQVVSLELAEEMKKLGAKQDSILFWTWTEWNEMIEWVLIIQEEAARAHKTSYSAYTVAELGEMLDTDTVSGRIVIDEEEAKKWCCLHFSIPEFEVWDDRTQFADTEADARAKMWIHLKKEEMD